MDRFHRMMIAALALLGIAGAAAADAKVELTAAERTEVADACRSGLPLIPVQSDFGYETGEYALPLSSDGEEVNSAFILSADALRDIASCSATLEQAEAATDSNANAAIS